MGRPSTTSWDNIRVANSASLGITGSITVSAWVKRTNLGFAALLTKTNSIARYDYQFMYSALNEVDFYRDGVAPVDIKSTPTIVDAVFRHHVAVSILAGVPKIGTFYIDGAAVAGGGTQNGAYNNNPDPVIIGYDVEANSAIGGSLDELRLSAVGLDGAVELEWATGSEIDNLGFHVYRSLSAAGPYERITASLIPGLGSSPEGARYGYLDVGRVNGVTYHYQLEDVEATGSTRRHGPVWALPRAGAEPPPGPGTTPPPGSGTTPPPGPGTTPPPGAADDPSEPGKEPGPARMKYGDPEATRLRVVERSERGVTLELVTGGFYAVPEPDGEVWLEIPGFENGSEVGGPAIPVERTWVETIVGRQVRLGQVSAEDVVSFSSLRPVASGAPELVERDGTLRPVLRRRPQGKAFRRPGLYPEQAARVLELAFQGETKKARLELSPLRLDRSSGRLLLARRLTLRLEFGGDEPGEISGGGSRGRAHRGQRRLRGQGVVARLVTQQRGLYAVSFEDLFGPRGRAVSASDLRLSRQGQPVGFHLEPDTRRFGRGTRLYFVGQDASVNPYGAGAVYELSLEPGGVQMPVQSASAPGSSLDHYWQRARWEQNRRYQAGALQAEDPWLWDALVSPTTRSYPLPVSALAASSEPSRLQVWLVGDSDFDVAPDHHLRLHVNGYLAGEASWDGKARYEISALLPPGILHEGDNVLQIENVGDTGAAYSLVFLDRYALSYPRRLAAQAGVLEGSFSQFGEAQVVGLSPGASLLDVSQDPPRWLSGTWDTGLRFQAEAGSQLPGGLARGGAQAGAEKGLAGHATQRKRQRRVPAAGPAGVPGAGRTAIGPTPGPGPHGPRRGDRGRVRRVRLRGAAPGGGQGVPLLRLPLLAAALAALRAAAR